MKLSMQLNFGYDLKPKVWDESGWYAFAIVFRVEILRKRGEKKVDGCAQDDWSTTTKGDNKV